MSKKQTEIRELSSPSGRVPFMRLVDLFSGLAALFVVHCSMLVFVFLLAYFVGLRDLTRIFDFRTFAANVIRCLLG